MGFYFQNLTVELYNNTFCCIFHKSNSINILEKMQLSIESSACWAATQYFKIIALKRCLGQCEYKETAVWQQQSTIWVNGWRTMTSYVWTLLNVGGLRGRVSLGFRRAKWKGFLVDVKEGNREQMQKKKKPQVVNSAQLCISQTQWKCPPQNSRLLFHWLLCTNVRSVTPSCFCISCKAQTLSGPASNINTPTLAHIYTLTNTPLALSLSNSHIWSLSTPAVCPPSSSSHTPLFLLCPALLTLSSPCRYWTWSLR